MIEIDDLGGVGKVQIRLIPNPFAAVPQHHFFLRSRPTPLPGFGIQSAAEFVTVLDRAHVACGSFVPNGIAFFIYARLREYAAQLSLACVRWLAILFAGAAFGFFAHHRNAGATHLHIPNGTALPLGDRPLYLHGPPWLAWLMIFFISADALGVTSPSFGGNRQPRQQLHLLPALIERTFLADRSQHAAHAGREFRVLYIQLHIHRKLTTMAVLAQVVRASTLGLSHRRQHGFRTHLHISGRMPASTR